LILRISEVGGVVSFDRDPHEVKRLASEIEPADEACKSYLFSDGFLAGDLVD